MYVIKMNHLLVPAAAILGAAVIVSATRSAVRTSAPAAEGVRVPILMYHITLPDSNGNQYIVPPADFENDLKFLSGHGYTTIVIQDLIDYVYEGAELPEKPVILTFDDGYYNNYAYIYPLLEQYQAKAVISIVGSYTDSYTENPDPNVNYAYLSWDQVKEMADSGLVEIQNHTYDLHSLDKGRKGCKKKTDESEEEYEELLTVDLSTVQEECLEHLGSAPTAFTYPFGFVSDASLDIVKALGFKASLCCEEGTNELERRPEQLYLLKRYIRTPARRAADILSGDN